MFCCGRRTSTAPALGFVVSYADSSTVLQMVEKSIGQVDLCSAESMLQIIKDLQSLKEAG